MLIAMHASTSKVVYMYSSTGVLLELMTWLQDIITSDDVWLTCQIGKQLINNIGSDQV